MKFIIFYEPVDEGVCDPVGIRAAARRITSVPVCGEMAA
jgi:hypothetical protein